MPRAKVAEGNRVHFYCPGCSCVHGVVYGQTNSWSWNEDLDFPTFIPSVLVTYDYGNMRFEDDPEFVLTKTICHSFVTEGRIKFLDDCTHDLKGQTVDIPEWPYE